MHKKIVWAEGILLSQQHFQQWDQRQQYRVWQLQQLQNPYSWGVITLKIDECLLRSGNFHINQCQLILPNGQYIQINDNSSDQIEYQLENDQESIINMYLCMPNNPFVENITGYKRITNIPAWKATYDDVQDLYDQKRERELIFAEPNIKLLSKKPESQQYVSIKLAEIICKNENHFQLNDEYIAPLVKIRGSTTLVRFIKRFKQLINDKIKNLAYSEHCNLLPILAAIYGELTCILTNDHHPCKLYEVIAKLYYVCAANQIDVNNHLPEYDHTNLYQSFNSLHQKIEYLMQGVAKSNVIKIPLNEVANNRYEAKNIDQTVFDKCQLYIVIHKQNADSTWINQFKSRIKIASVSMIDAIIVAAMPGLKTEYIHTVPRKISVKPGYEYFRLINQGDHWQQIKQEKSLIIVLSHEINYQDIELVAIEE